MKKAFIAEGALNLALACSTGTGDAEKAEPVACNHCLGTGQMVRDPDIGTDQECFVCDGSGFVTAPRPALEEAESAEPVAMWQRNSDTQEIEFAVIGDPYVVNGTKLYTEQQLNELICQLSTAKSLSVTNILINVVPGEDGMGEEVYAKSVAEVEREFSRLSQKLDAVEQQRDELVAMLRKVEDFLVGPTAWTDEQVDSLIEAVYAALAKVGAGNTQHPVSTD